MVSSSYIPADTTHLDPETKDETLVPRGDAQPHRLLCFLLLGGMLGVSRRGGSSGHLCRQPQGRELSLTGCIDAGYQLITSQLHLLLYQVIYQATKGQFR